MSQSVSPMKMRGQTVLHNTASAPVNGMGNGNGNGNGTGNGSGNGNGNGSMSESIGSSNGISMAAPLNVSSGSVFRDPNLPGFSDAAPVSAATSSSTSTTASTSSRRPGSRRMSMQDAIDVSKIDMRLYSERRRKNTLTGDAIREGEENKDADSQTIPPVISVSSAPTSTPHVDFTLRYDRDTRLLELHLIGVNDLRSLPSAAALETETDHLNPYCRLQLLPDLPTEAESDSESTRFGVGARDGHGFEADQSGAFQSKVLKGTWTPHFDESFKFAVESSEVGLKVLQFCFFHDADSDEDAVLAPRTTTLSQSQSQSRLCIGHMLFSLSNLQFNQTLPFRRPIVDGPPTQTENTTPCCLLLSLAYLVGAERVTVTVTKVSNLRLTKGKVQCKITVAFPGGSPKKKKTSAMRIVNGKAELQEAVTFKVNRKVIQQTKLLVEIVHKATFQKAQQLGSLELGPDATGYAYAHWNDMVNSKDSLPRWHQLSTPADADNNNTSINLFRSKSIPAERRSHNGGGVGVGVDDAVGVVNGNGNGNGIEYSNSSGSK